MTNLQNRIEKTNEAITLWSQGLLERNTFYNIIEKNGFKIEREKNNIHVLFRNGTPLFSKRI